MLSLGWAVAAAGCLPGGCLPDLEPIESWPYVELVGRDSGEVRRWTVLRGSWPTGAGERQLGPIAYDVAEVRYRFDEGSHHALFLMEGDLAEGIPGIDPGERWRTAGQSAYYQLPLPASWEEPRVFDLPVTPGEFGGGLSWGDLVGSFRVYDQGACSGLVSWRDLVRSMGLSLQRQVRASDDVDNAVVERSWLRPVIRAAVDDPYRPEALGLPQDRPLDGFRAGWRVRLDTPGLFGCSSERVYVEVEARLHRTAMAYAEVSMRRFLRACLGLGGARRDAQIWPVYEEQLRETLREGRWGALLRSCSAEEGILLPHFGLVRWDDIDALLLREDYSHIEGDTALLVGVEDVWDETEGRHRPVGARDVLLELVRLRAWHRGDCLYGGRIASELREGVGKGLVLGFWKAVREQAVVDPFLIRYHAIARHRPGREDPGASPSREELTAINNLACNTDADCDASGGDPAFTITDPETREKRWMGTRHVCRRRTEATIREFRRMVAGNIYSEAIWLEDVNNLRPEWVCHFAIEPQWPNVRPDGLEAVLVGDPADHPQTAALVGPETEPYAPSLFRLGACDLDADGYLSDPDVLFGQVPSLGPRPGAVPADQDAFPGAVGTSVFVGSRRGR